MDKLIEYVKIIAQYVDEETFLTLWNAIGKAIYTNAKEVE